MTDFEQRAVELANETIELSSVDSRGILVGTANNEYYLTLGDYGLGFSKAYLQVWNETGEKVKIHIEKGQSLKITLPVTIQAQEFTIDAKTEQ